MSGSQSTGKAAAAFLAVVEHASRGGVETQYADVLYLVRELHRQLGRLDLLLRGPAVSYAVAAEPVPPVVLAGQRLVHPPDPRQSIRQLLLDGIVVYAECPEIAGLLPQVGSNWRLLDGVLPVPAGAVTARWPSYRQVWFL